MTSALPPRVHLRSQPALSGLVVITAARVRGPDVVDRADSGRTLQVQRVFTIP